MQFLRRRLFDVIAVTIGLIAGLILFSSYERHYLVIVFMPLIAWGCLHIIRNPLMSLLDIFTSGSSDRNDHR